MNWRYMYDATVPVLFRITTNSTHAARFKKSDTDWIPIHSWYLVESEMGLEVDLDRITIETAREVIREFGFPDPDELLGRGVSDRPIE